MLLLGVAHVAEESGGVLHHPRVRLVDVVHLQQLLAVGQVVTA